MDNLNKLMSCLVLYKHNMSALHWKCTGLDFDTIHNLTDMYAKTLDAYTDEVAEILLQLNCDPICIKGCLEILENDEKEYVYIDTRDNFSSASAINYINIMFISLMALYAKVCEDESIPSDIRGKLEEQRQWVRLEYSYKNKQRMK